MSILGGLYVLWAYIPNRFIVIKYVHNKLIRIVYVTHQHEISRMSAPIQVEKMGNVHYIS